MADITLIRGTTLGSAEYVAEHLADKLEKAGFSIETLHGQRLDELPLFGRWLVVSSTHGAGALPNNLQPLLEQIANKQPDLSNMQFGAICLGGSEYDTFYGAIKHIDNILISIGATRIGSRFKIDLTEHEIPEDPAEEYVKNWINLG